MECVLTKVMGGAALRTPSVRGVCERKPQIGASFIMGADPLEGGFMRIVETSHIIRIDSIPSEQGWTAVLAVTETGSLYEIKIKE